MDVGGRGSLVEGGEESFKKLKLFAG